LVVVKVGISPKTRLPRACHPPPSVQTTNFVYFLLYNLSFQTFFVFARFGWEIFSQKIGGGDLFFEGRLAEFRKKGREVGNENLYFKGKELFYYI
jgi:hypothetical protein